MCAVLHLTIGPNLLYSSVSESVRGRGEGEGVRGKEGGRRKKWEGEGLKVREEGHNASMRVSMFFFLNYVSSPSL